jgi:hypothetical protein
LARPPDAVLVAGAPDDAGDFLADLTAVRARLEASTPCTLPARVRSRISAAPCSPGSARAPT